MRELPRALRPLTRRLEAVRARWLARRGLELGAWVLLAATTAWVALRVWNYLPAPDVSAGAALGTAIGLLALGFVAVLLYLWRTAPTLGQAAQMAERNLGLKERLSTALEVASVPANPLQGPLRQALLDDAARHSELVVAARAVPITWPRAGRYLLGAVALAALVWFMPQPQGQAATSASPAAEAAQVAAALQALIQEVQQDAERTNDPYLQAEARNLEQLRSQVQGGNLGGEALRELGSSLGRLAQSYGVAPAAPEAAGAPKPGGVQSPDAAPGSAQASAVASAQAAQRSLERLAQAVRSQRQSAPGTSPPNPDELSRECIYIEGYECLTSAQVAKLQQELAGAGARVPVKAPEGGTPGGSGDRAGKGAQAKLGGQQKLESRPAAQPVALPKHAPSDSRRRIQISAPTELARALEPVQGTAGDWRFGEEAAAGQGLQGLGPEGRAAVAQYFARKEE